MISGECLVQHPDLRAPEWDLDRLSFKPVLLCWCLSRGPTWPIAYDPQRLLVKAIRSIRSSKCKQTSQLSPCEEQSQCCMLRAIFTFHSYLPSLQLLSMDYDQADPSLVSHLIPRKYCISCNILGAFMGGSAKHWSSWLTVGAPLNPFEPPNCFTSLDILTWNTMKHHNDHNETDKPISLGSSRQSWPCFLCPGLLSASAARPFCTKTLHSSSKAKLTSWNNHGISWIIMDWNQPRSLYRTSFHLEGQLCPKMHQHASDRASKLWRGMSNVGLLVEQCRWFLREVLVRCSKRSICHVLMRPPGQPTNPMEIWSVSHAAESAAVSCCLLYPLISRMQAGWCRMQAQERFGMFGDSSLPACRCSVSSCALHNTSGTWLNTFHNHVRWPPELAATCLAQFRNQNAQFYRYIERENKQTRGAACSFTFFSLTPKSRASFCPMTLMRGRK